MIDSEREYKAVVCNGLRALGWSIQWHEDKYANYIPDVSFGAHGIDGWIEVKFRREPPKTLGHISHYTIGQEDWLIERGQRGSGACYLLVGTGAGHLLLPHSALRNARTATYIAAQSLPGALWVPGQLELVGTLCVGMDRLLAGR